MELFEEFSQLVAEFKKEGLEYALCGGLAKISPDSSDTLVLDMLLLTPEIKEVWETKQILSWDQGDLPVVSPKGLIKLKSMRLSGQDRDDIKNLEGLIDEG